MLLDDGGGPMAAPVRLIYDKEAAVNPPVGSEEVDVKVVVPKLPP